MTTSAICASLQSWTQYFILEPTHQPFVECGEKHGVSIFQWMSPAEKVMTDGLCLVDCECSSYNTEVASIRNSTKETIQRRLKKTSMLKRRLKTKYRFLQRWIKRRLVPHRRMNRIRAFWPSRGKACFTMKEQTHKVSMSTRTILSRMCPSCCLLNTDAGPNLVSPGIRDWCLLDSFHQYDMPKILFVFDSKLTLSGIIFPHLCMEIVCTRITFAVLDELLVSVLPWATIINSFTKSIHSTELKMVPHHSLLVLILMVLDGRSRAEKYESESSRERRIKD